jgi:hypothetical protein
MKRRFVAAWAVLAALAVAGSAWAAAPLPSVKATLTSRAEVPKVGPSGSGSVVITFNTKTGEACWTYHVTGLTKILASHVHKAPPGKSGAVTIPLGDRWSLKGCVQTKPAVLKAVLANPSAYYVNIHTRQYINGAIRGQLHR